MLDMLLALLEGATGVQLIVNEAGNLQDARSAAAARANAQAGIGMDWTIQGFKDYSDAEIDTLLDALGEQCTLACDNPGVIGVVIDCRNDEGTGSEAFVIGCERHRAKVEQIIAEGEKVDRIDAENRLLGDDPNVIDADWTEG